MAINTTAGLLDAIVLAVVGREETGTYGYKITQEVRTVLDLSESTLYPVLRRLQKDGCLTVHDEAFNGRNRRYYQITPTGRARLAEFTAEWEAYTTKINNLCAAKRDPRLGGCTPLGTPKRKSEVAGAKRTQYYCPFLTPTPLPPP